MPRDQHRLTQINTISCLRNHSFNQQEAEETARRLVLFREMLSFSKKEAEPLMEYPVSFCGRMESFGKTRVASQQEHMQATWRKFDDGMRAIVPFFETEMRGVPMLQRLCEVMLGAESARGAPGAPVGPPQQAGASS